MQCRRQRRPTMPKTVPQAMTTPLLTRMPLPLLAMMAPPQMPFLLLQPQTVVVRKRRGVLLRRPGQLALVVTTSQ